MHRNCNAAGSRLQAVQKIAWPLHRLHHRNPQVYLFVDPGKGIFLGQGVGPDTPADLRYMECCEDEFRSDSGTRNGDYSVHLEAHTKGSNLRVVAAIPGRWPAQQQRQEVAAEATHSHPDIPL